MGRAGIFDAAIAWFEFTLAKNAGKAATHGAAETGEAAARTAERYRNLAGVERYPEDVPNDPSTWSALRNDKPESRAAELDEAERLGVRPLGPDDPGFDEMLNEGTVKWGVLENGELRIVPKYVDGVEIAHPVLGEGLKAAGEADIAGGRDLGYFGSMNNHSGHYLPPGHRTDLGAAGFKVFGDRLGILVRVEPSDLV